MRFHFVLAALALFVGTTTAQEKGPPPVPYPNTKGELRADAKDDAVRKLKIERYNSLKDALNRFNERKDGGVYKASEEMASHLSVMENLLAVHLELVTDHAGRLKALQERLDYAKDLELYFEGRCKRGETAYTHPMFKAHRLDVEIRLEELKKTMKK